MRDVTHWPLVRLAKLDGSLVEQRLEGAKACGYIVADGKDYAFRHALPEGILVFREVEKDQP